MNGKSIVVSGFCILVILLVISTSQALKCYTCDSRNDTKCRQSFDVDDPTMYVTECDDSEKVCQKLIINMITTVPTIVKRRCFDARMIKNKTEYYLPDKCRDEENGLEACYCDSDLCNGQSSIISSFVTYLIMPITAIVYVILM